MKSYFGKTKKDRRLIFGILDNQCRVKKHTKYLYDINIIIDSKYRGEDQDEKMFQEIKNIGDTIHTSIN